MAETAEKRRLALLKKRKHDVDLYEIEDVGLQYWFELTGTTLDDLHREIDRLQPGNDPVDYAGLHAEIAGAVLEHPGPINNQWRIVICRAMQRVAIKRTAHRNARQGSLF